MREAAIARKYRKHDVLDTGERLDNRGRWCPDDEIGALDFRPEDIVAAARLVRRQVFPLGLALAQNEPQAGVWGRSLEPDRQHARDRQRHERRQARRDPAPEQHRLAINPLAIKSGAGGGTAMKCWTWGCAAAALLAAQIGLAAEPATGETRAPPTRTVKERLSSKASDDQRVDNCKVPPELRGPKSRPDCRERPDAAPTH